MLNPENLSEEELKLVVEIAKARGISPEQVLIELGHQPVQTAAEDVTVSLGNKEDQEPEMPAPEEPIEVATDDPGSFPDTPETGPAIEPPPPPALEVEESEKKEDDDSALQSPSTINDICPHCGIDMTQAVIEEPEHAQKLAFLHALLGGVCYSHKMKMFDGSFSVTFRTLTVKEIDALYAATYDAAQKKGKLASATDYYEYLNRLRLNVQIISLTGTSAALHHKLPDGLSAATNSKADQYWDEFLKEKNLYVEDVSLVEQIQDYVLEHVLPTEQLLRIITHECQKFNRLASKLEARVDDVNFWKETKQLS